MPGLYVPDVGDIVWLEFDPQSGHEQAGHRPALVLSPALYNRKTSLMVCCPLTSQVKGNPFEVATYVGGVHSAILTNHVKSLDWKARKAKFKEKVEANALEETRAKLKALLQLS